MPNNRPIPKVDTKQYAEQGVIICRPEKDAVALEVHHCTAFLSQAELVSVVRSAVDAGGKLWGAQFLSTIREVL